MLSYGVLVNKWRKRDLSTDYQVAPRSPMVLQPIDRERARS